MPVYPEPVIKTLLLLLAGIMLGCSIRSEVVVKEIWLPVDLRWQASQTGLPEIDASRKESYSDVIVFFDDKLFHGAVGLYQQIGTDSIVIAFESGEMVFTGKGCSEADQILNRKSGDTNNKFPHFTQNGSLLLNGKLFNRTNRFSIASKKQLADELRVFCR